MIARILRFPASNPAVTLAALGLLSALFLGAFDVDYDASGMRGILFWFTQLLRAPFWAADEFLYFLSGGRRIMGHTIIAIIAGFALCIAIDAAIRFVGRRWWHKQPLPPSVRE